MIPGERGGGAKRERREGEKKKTIKRKRGRDRKVTGEHLPTQLEWGKRTSPDCKRRSAPSLRAFPTPSRTPPVPQMG